jgi:hypothetical protein
LSFLNLSVKVASSELSLLDSLSANPHYFKS